VHVRIGVDERAHPSVYYMCRSSKANRIKIRCEFPNRTFEVQASTPTEVTEWIMAIVHALATLQEEKLFRMRPVARACAVTFQIGCSVCTIAYTCRRCPRVQGVPPSCPSCASEFETLQLNS
jgi:hypothetical protein